MSEKDPNTNVTVRWKKVGLLGKQSIQCFNESNSKGCDKGTWIVHEGKKTTALYPSHCSTIYSVHALRAYVNTTLVCVYITPYCIAYGK